MTKRHKVFVSFHHGDENDPNRGEVWKDEFVNMMTDYTNAMVDQSVNDGDIQDGLKVETIRQKIRDDYLADSTVTVVLIGPDTWKRKHVDWEISSSLRHTQNSPRPGLLGVLLPTYAGYDRNIYDPNTIPPRLADNLTGDAPFAKVIRWENDPYYFQDWIHWAFERRNQEPPPNNSRTMYANNRPDSSKGWAD